MFEVLNLKSDASKAILHDLVGILDIKILQLGWWPPQALGATNYWWCDTHNMCNIWLVITELISLITLGLGIGRCFYVGQGGTVWDDARGMEKGGIMMLSAMWHTWCGVRQYGAYSN
jgi:hypothetical protein